MSDDVLLEVKNLCVNFYYHTGIVKALNGVDFTINRGESVGVVGESGCGKSVTARSIMRIIPHPGEIVKGDILFYPERDKDPVEITALSAMGSKMRGIRGKDIAMIFQEPMVSFSPVHTVGDQIMEVIKLHQKIDPDAVREKAVNMLDIVGIPDPSQRLNTYPFELSGGMRQRAMIAMMLSCEPSLLIADEPTTALDVTVQAQILELLQRLQQEFNMSVMMITHNLGVIAAITHRVVVMYLGQVVEKGTAEQIFDDPKHPYTRGLLKSVPNIGHKTGKRLWNIKGTVPDATVDISGCQFHPRCPDFIKGKCDKEEPDYVKLENGREVRCFLYSNNVVKEGEVQHAGSNTGN